MKENAISLLMILVGGFIIDLGFLYLSSTRRSWTIIILGAILFWNGFRRLT